MFDFGPAVDPTTFAELDTRGWPTTKLPRAGVSLRLPRGVRVTESGKLAVAPVGPYIGLTLPSGYDVQVDTSESQLADSTAMAKEAEAAGSVKILLAAADALVRQPTGVEGCFVVACKQLGATSLCGSAGKRVVMRAGGKDVKWPTLGDCSALLAVVRSIEPI